MRASKGKSKAERGSLQAQHSGARQTQGMPAQCGRMYAPDDIPHCRLIMVVAVPVK